MSRIKTAASIETQGDRRTGLVFGPIKTAEFAHQLSDFVYSVAQFKEQAINGLAIRWRH